MMPMLYVGVGGFIGAILRYAASLALNGRMGAFPIGTLAVNAIGCFAMGALVAWLEIQEEMPENLRLALGVGLLGALTTFSAFGIETLDLMRDGSMRLAFLSIVLNVGVGLGAVWLGRSLLSPGT